MKDLIIVSICVVVVTAWYLPELHPILQDIRTLLVLLDNWVRDNNIVYWLIGGAIWWGLITLDKDSAKHEIRIKQLEERLDELE